MKDKNSRISTKSHQESKSYSIRT